ncbi:DUF1152 domain-containing protein [Micromonospora sp. NPDC048839]|uniref:DUF1152 domain-containing protein n=1 Tax=Micromonospora sp. NPDC048839 TaxID=3155641 RepID=UPI0033CABBBD
MITPAALSADSGAFSLAVPPLVAALAPARSILIAGAGGGFDVYAGLPLAFALWRAGAQVHLANLSFSELELIDRDAWVVDNVAAVQPDTASPDWYFPERTLARWLAAQQLPSTVYAFPPLGVQPLRAAYRHLVEHLDIDAVVLVDGGTDVLLRGDESDLGTPVEDMTSVAAVAARPSIVQGQIAAATSGAFGDVRFTRRTGGGDLFVNPLMAIYFTVDLDKLAARCLYLDRIENTVGRRQVITRIQAFRDELLDARIPRAFPH